MNSRRGSPIPHLAASTVVCDCRYYLADHHKGRHEYDEAHIPGALFVDVHTELAGGPGGGRHPLPTVRRLHAPVGPARHLIGDVRRRLRQLRRRHRGAAVVDAALDRPRPGRRARRRLPGVGRSWPAGHRRGRDVVIRSTTPLSRRGQASSTPTLLPKVWHSARLWSTHAPTTGSVARTRRSTRWPATSPARSTCSTRTTSPPTGGCGRSTSWRRGLQASATARSCTAAAA